MPRSSEEQIRELCSRVTTVDENTPEFHRLCAELRDALSAHIGKLRKDASKLSTLPKPGKSKP